MSTALLHRVPARDLTPPMPRALHPAAQEAAAAWSDMMTSLDSAQAEIGQLKADLNVERRHVADLTRLLAIEREAKERYQRYAVRIGTHLEHIVNSASAAHDCAMQFAKEPPPEEPPRTVPIDAAKLVAELSEAVQAARETTPAEGPHET